MRDDTNCGIGRKLELLHVTGHDFIFSLCSNHMYTRVSLPEAANRDAALNLLCSFYPKYKIGLHELISTSTSVTTQHVSK